MVFAWIVYRSRAHRDQVNAKVMKDPRMASMDPETAPFDPNRMLYGGFETIVDVVAASASPRRGRASSRGGMRKAAERKPRARAAAR